MEQKPMIIRKSIELFMVAKNLTCLLFLILASSSGCKQTEVSSLGPFAPSTKVLDLSNRGLTQVPNSVSNLNELKKLILFKNQIDTLPDFIGGKDSLEKLSLKSNRLVLIEPKAMDLPNLKELDLRFNKLVSIPDSMHLLPSLEILDLRNNQLKSLPSSIGTLKNLEQLYLSDNDIRTLPSTMKGLNRLKYLHIGRNSIQGALPEWIGEMDGLVELDVSGCCEDNRLPESISDLRKLEVLTVSSYQVLPNSLGRGNPRLVIRIR
jgi:Leucine-rich repeat (LRR) protein